MEFVSLAASQDLVGDVMPLLRHVHSGRLPPCDRRQEARRGGQGQRDAEGGVVTKVAPLRQRAKGGLRWM